MDYLDVDYCIVGGGFAGLAAANKLKQSDCSVVVLEARNRIGGRVYTEILPDKTAIDWGGTFIGEGHERLYALIKEFGCETFRSNIKGDKLLLIDGKVQRFSGAIPRVNPFALVDLGLAIKMFDSMAKKIPLDAPWEAKNAEALDSQTLGSWIDSPLHTLTDTAKKMLKSIWTEIFMSHPNEVSLLHALFISHSLKNIEWIVSEEGGAQQDLLVGGMQGLLEKMVARLNLTLRLNAPVFHIAQDLHGVTVTSKNVIVKAKRVIVAVPPILKGRIEYEPLLPLLYTQLMERSSLGQAIRCYAIYPEPFWRNEGLSGIGADMDDIPQVCIDASGKKGIPGILTAYIMGPPARFVSTLSSKERRDIFVNGLEKRFGKKASQPIYFADFNWAAEKWTGGDMFAHYAPGVLTGFGSVLRKPCGRIHWAGTETATKWAGSMEGAIRSGERAATEVLNEAGSYVNA